MGPLAHAAQTLFEDLRGTNPTDKEISRAALAYLQRMNGTRPSSEMVMELADAATVLLDEDHYAEARERAEGEGV